ncbi:unnamed protein product [Lupinus luteus]|uniref:Glycosyltransferase subfamily 4-like N-terminal domain-containing protein n=1 Tax=Lupinus luteus TaxID=3873 RepID=A0AAV1W408_LUPLU
MKLQPYNICSSFSFLSITYVAIITLILIFTHLLFFTPIKLLKESSFSFQPEHLGFNGDLRDANFPWNKLCFGPTHEKLKLAAFSKAWPIGAEPGGMERHAYTLYHALAARGHEIHVFSVPSDRKHHRDIHEQNLHVYFAANDHWLVDISLAFEIFSKINAKGTFDYVHTESVALPYWRAKMVPNVAVTWHGIWYEIMHSKLFQELLSYQKGFEPGNQIELQEALPKLIEEIRFFSNYKQHICISNSACQVLVNAYQLPQRNVHIILNGIDDTKFVHDPELGMQSRRKYGVPGNVSIVMGVAGRMVRDKGHPLLFKAFSVISKRFPGVFLLVAGSGPWERRYAELGSNVKVLGALEPSELSGFYNALDVFVNPTLRPQGLDLTLIEAMHCGKPLIAPNYPSIVGNVVVNEDYGHTFSPNLESLIHSLEAAMRDGPKILEKKGMACKELASSMFTANKMSLAYERFFLCMKDTRYCQILFKFDVQNWSKENISAMKQLCLFTNDVENLVLRVRPLPLMTIIPKWRSPIISLMINSKIEVWNYTMFLKIVRVEEHYIGFILYQSYESTIAHKNKRKAASLNIVVSQSIRSSPGEMEAPMEFYFLIICPTGPKQIVDNK